MSNDKIAQTLGASHEFINLQRKSKKEWWAPVSRCWTRVERAALEHYQVAGWSGYAGEAGLVLNLIKAASFPNLPLRHRSVFVEALYARNVAFDEDRYEVSNLLRSVRNSTLRQIKSNYAALVDRTPVERWGFQTKECMLDFFPELTQPHFTGFFSALGSIRLFQIAEIFARDPYQYRRGWPDLTLWDQRGRVAFKEIKAPGDGIGPAQRRIMNDILLKLGLETAIVDVNVR